jgi:hypothetical protein
MPWLRRNQTIKNLMVSQLFVLVYHVEVPSTDFGRVQRVEISYHSLCKFFLVLGLIPTHHCPSICMRIVQNVKTNLHLKKQEKKTDSNR